MISTSNVSMQFGSKALFENISITFSNNNRYGLIGANGSGKSTFMKILANELEQSSGTVQIDIGSLPTSDPTNAGQLFRDGTDLKVSLG